MNTLIIIFIGILFASSGQILWKVGMTDIGPITSVSMGSFVSIVLSPWVISGTLCYGLSTVFWLIALSRADLSFVYPFISLTFVIIFIASFLLFHEQISAIRLLGAIIIISGIIVLVIG